MNKINIDEIINVLKENENIKFAYLFGSHAKNKTRYGSDLDIALYFENEPELTDIGTLVIELEKAADCNIDLVSLKELYKKNPKLAYSVIDEGTLLFNFDEAFLGHYKKKVFLHYLDFKPVIDLFTSKLYERVSNNKFAAAEPRVALSYSKRKK
jgi:uncharacterized protein